MSSGVSNTPYREQCHVIGKSREDIFRYAPTAAASRQKYPSAGAGQRSAPAASAPRPPRLPAKQNDRPRPVDRLVAAWSMDPAHARTPPTHSPPPGLGARAWITRGWAPPLPPPDFCTRRRLVQGSRAGRPNPGPSLSLSSSSVLSPSLSHLHPGEPASQRAKEPSSNGREALERHRRREATADRRRRG